MIKNVLGAAALVASLVSGAANAENREIAITHYGALTYGIPIAVAFHGGYFAEEGVDVSSILASRGGGDAVRTSLATNFPWGEAGLPAVLAAHNSGLDLVITNIAIGDVGDTMWVSKKGSGITSLADLAGKTVSYTQPRSGSHMNLTTVLEREGLTDEVETVASGGLREGLTMVGSGAVAAAPIVEPMASLMADRFDVVFRVSDYFEPGAQIVGFTTREFAEANPELVAGAIAARARAVRLMRDDPEAAASLASAAYPNVPVPVLADLIGRLGQGRFWSEGALDVDAFVAMEDTLVAAGALDATGYDWTQILDDRWQEK